MKLSNFNNQCNFLLFYSVGEGSAGKGNVVSQVSVGQNKAPAVLWDVGIDVGSYPEITIRNRAARMEASENAFWEGVLYEQTKTTQELTDSEEGDDMPLLLNMDETLGKEGAPAVLVDDGSSSTNNTAVICAGTGSKATSCRMEVGFVLETAIAVEPVGQMVSVEDKGIAKASYISFYFHMRCHEMNNPLSCLHCRGKQDQQR